MKIMMKNQLGLSLVEILVALVISIFLLGGIAQVYMGSKSTYRFSDASSRIQENGRFAIDALTTDMRMAGFWGCVSFQPDGNNDGLLEDDNPDIQNHLAVNGNYDPNIHDFINLPAVTATVNDGLNGSDKLTLRGAKPGQSVFVANLVQPGDTDIIVSENNSFQVNDFILITNCQTANIIEATAVDTNAGITTISHTTAGQTSTPGNSANLNDCSGFGANCLMNQKDEAYIANNSAAFSLQAVTYSIQVGASGEPALFRSVNNVDEELIEGIENFQVKFGEDTDGDGVPNQYLDSNNVANMLQVVSLRIWLVARSERDGILDDNQVYTVMGQPVTAADNRFRQVFSTTIDLRNR